MNRDLSALLLWRRPPARSPWLRRLRRELGGERGSVSVWMITTALTMMLCVGLAVDLGGQVHAKQRTQAIAAEAARAGGQQLQASVAVRGDAAVVDPTSAIAAAKAYLAAVPDVTGTVTLASGGRVEVATQSVYATKILSMIGVTALPVTGHAEVQINRVLEGTPR